MTGGLAVKVIRTGFDPRVKRIRRQVFVKEQGVPYKEEFDELDATALHWLALVGEVPMGTVRLTLERALPRQPSEPGGPEHGDQPARSGRLGRLAVLKEQRGQGLGSRLVAEVVRSAREAGLETLEAWVQTWAEPWYRKRGFVIFDEVFDDAGLPHRKARLRL